MHKKIGIIGCGWLGTKLATHLQSQNHSIYTSSTSTGQQLLLREKGFNAFFLNFGQNNPVNKDIQQVFSDLDAIIVSIPVSKRRDNQPIFDDLTRFLHSYKGQLFLFSSVGIYPRVEQIITEDNIAASELNEHILKIENLLRNDFPQLVTLRLGGLMGGKRVFSSYFKNKKILQANDTVNHVHYEDICNIITKMLAEEPKFQVYNIVAPEHPTKQAVFDAQNGIVSKEEREDVFEKIISVQQCVGEFAYRFSWPDPGLF